MGRVPCSSCAGAIELKTFACGNPLVPEGRAWKSEKPLDGVAPCLACDHYVSAETPAS